MPFDSDKLKMHENEGEMLELIKEILEIIKDGKVTQQEKSTFLDRIRNKFKR